MCLIKTKKMIPSKASNFTVTGTKTARVVGMHDGDTMNCVFEFGGAYYKFPVRMNGIDTPEMTSKDPILKHRALSARNRLFSLVTDRPQSTLAWTKKDFDKYFEDNYTTVILECKGLDKYGRVLADVGSPTFSSILVKEGHAYVYTGQTKMTEDQQLQLGV